MREQKCINDTEKTNYIQALQYHLYRKPLYTCCESGETSLNVLIIGFGNCGRKFLDLCLPIGQMRGKVLQVTVVSNDEADKQKYLAVRPELAEYFAVDHSVDTQDYGSISFQTASLSSQTPSGCNSVVQDILVKCCETEQWPHYIFIALDNDMLNKNAALAAWEAAEILDMHTSIQYVWEGEPLQEALPEHMHPVNVSIDVQKNQGYADIERMAFNTHLIWEKDQNTDYRTLRTNFRKPYNHDSCVGNVVSLKYKLYSIGIDLDQIGFDAAAKCFHSEKKTWKNELIWLEHRRWVTEKLCDGWCRLHDLEQCVSGQTKDAKDKRHVCILRSEPNQNLAAFFKANNYQKWDTATTAELNKLDDLDRMSVLLHRMYVKKAEEMRKMNLLSNSSIAPIRNLIGNHKRSMVTFQEWYTCLKEIWNRDYSKVRLYNGLKSSFLNSVEDLPEQSRRSVIEQVKAFEAMFYPILASVEYRDFKQDDVALVDSIPFILTYRDSIYMAIPYATGDNTAVFSNIAAATVVNPARILFLANLDSKYAMAEIKSSLPYVVQFAKKRKLRAELEFVIAYNPRTAADVSEEALVELKELGGGRLRKVKLICGDNPVSLSEELQLYLYSRRKRKPVFLVEKNQTALSYLLQGTGFYGHFSNYRFDTSTMKFHSLEDCGLLAYIKKKAAISVADMAAFKQSVSESSNHPEFFGEYTALWEKYRQNSSVWKETCEVLARHANEKDKIASFRKKLDREKQSNASQYRYILPFICYRTVEKLLDFLAQHNIVETGTCVNGYTTDSCEVVIFDKCSYKQIYDMLFAQPYALMSPDAVDIHLNTGSHEVWVSFDNLVVENLLLEKGRKSDVKELMRFFACKGFVNNLRIQGDVLNFTYATRQIKSLLTTAGKILEIYTYHKAKELGKFDDVVSNYELNWEGTDVLSEFDCIITKGFSSLFIECKAMRDLNQEFYYKLTSLVQQFGVNAKAVLIADTQEKPFFDHAPVNSMQRLRGSMLDVITIWDPAEIQNIGQTLLDIINGNYVAKT